MKTTITKNQRKSIMKEEKKKWKIEEVMPIAERLYKEFAPHCKRIAVVGSVRRLKPEVSDIDLICIPEEYDWGLLEKGIAKAVNKYEKVTGTFHAKTKQVRRKTPEGICFDLWLVNDKNWGLAINTKTGPVGYNIGILIRDLGRAGYIMEDGYLCKKYSGEKVTVKEENDLYRLMGKSYKYPADRG